MPSHPSMHSAVPVMYVTGIPSPSGSFHGFFTHCPLAFNHDRSRQKQVHVSGAVQFPRPIMKPRHSSSWFD